MDFEFDPHKRTGNKEKHGIDFVVAQELWNDDQRIVFPACTVDEERFIMIGVVENKHWTVIYTIRGKNIRIISVRRARKEEVNLYEG